MTFDGGLPLRRGGRNPQNLYEQTGAIPDHDTDPSIGWAHNADYVTMAVLAVNHSRSIPGARWWCDGDENAALVCDRPGAVLASGWVIAVRSKAHGERIVAAVNGPGRAGDR